MTTRVENIYKYPEGPNTVYIGRAGKGRNGYFGNPYPLTREEDRGKIIERYIEYFIEQITISKEFRERIEGLRGKVLLCFCFPKTCHGDIIAAYLNYDEDEAAVAEVVNAPA